MDRLQGAAIDTQRFSASPALATTALAARRASADATSRERLRAALPSNAELLYRRRADLVGDDVIDDYVALHWLEWNAGALRLTTIGQNICDQLKAQSRESAGQ